jgi:hypothetical protein
MSHVSLRADSAPIRYRSEDKNSPDTVVTDLTRGPGRGKTVEAVVGVVIGGNGVFKTAIKRQESTSKRINATIATSGQSSKFRAKAKAAKAKKAARAAKKAAKVAASAVEGKTVMGPPKRKRRTKKLPVPKTTKGQKSKAPGRAKRRASTPEVAQATVIGKLVVKPHLVSPEVASAADSLVGFSHLKPSNFHIQCRLKHAFRFLQKTAETGYCENGPEMLRELLALAKLPNQIVTKIYLGLAMIYSTEMVEEDFNSAYYWLTQFAWSPYRLIYCNEATDATVDSILDNVKRAFEHSGSNLTKADIDEFNKMVRLAKTIEL